MQCKARGGVIPQGDLLRGVAAMATTSNAAVRPSDGEHIGKLFRARS